MPLACAAYEDEKGMFPKGRGRFETCPYSPHHAYFHSNGLSVGARITPKTSSPSMEIFA